jgi:endonuclease/exonuclease/phosphatase family metal-dependent hydrolase
VKSKSSNKSFLSLGSNLKICHINIDGISTSISEYPARLMHDEDIDIVTVQETHASEENLRRRGSIPEYILIGAIYSNVYCITYKASYYNCRTLYQDHSHDVHTLAVEIDGTIVVNVYKPPTTSWSNVPLKLFPHPAIYVGDFNSQNQLWGYEHNDEVDDTEQTSSNLSPEG